MVPQTVCQGTLGQNSECLSLRDYGDSQPLVASTPTSLVDSTGSSGWIVLSSFW